MGACVSIAEDPDDKVIRIKKQQEQKELFEFQQQLRRDNKHFLKNMPKDFSMSKQIKY